MTDQTPRPDEHEPATDDTSMEALLGTPDDGAAERARLEAAIAAAISRTAAARHRRAERDAEIRAALREEVLATQALLDEMDRNHQEALAALRETTQAEIARIIARYHTDDSTGSA